MMIRIAVLLCCLLPLGATAATTLKISTLYPDGTEVVNRIKQAGKTIAEQTDGRVKLKLYPGGVMGDDQAVQRKIRIGQLHGAIAQGGAFASAYKDSQIYNVPLAFNNYEEVDYVRERLDPVLREGFENNGWVTFGFIDGGFAYIMSNQPVKNVEQLREQKIWLPANDPLSAQLAEVLEISPIMLNIGAVLTSLQTGAIDAFAAPPVAALTLQWYSRVKYLTDMPLMYTFGMLAISDRHFSRIKEADRKVVRKLLSQAINDLDKSSREDNRQAFESVVKQGVEPVTPEEDALAEWHQYADKATQQLVEEGEFSAEMLARLNELLAEYRSADSAQ
jgi:TRAP-type C4-dicarboxylate transport system substrate-binding protein